ncbi:MAG TPA: hypothetical protein EYG85_11525 [Crocinitomix sp.]|nr:hypothetical protein [Crocinitomix sp.]
MDKKFFENMDKRFKSIENELKFSYDKNYWEQVESELDNSDLDAAFNKAVQKSTIFSNIDFNEIDDAFLDDAFVNAAKQIQYSYSPTYWNEFKDIESTLYYNDAFVTAAALNKVVYDPNYWKDADFELRKEGLHYEYKPEYWAEVEKLLIQDDRNGFFFKWGVAATILLLFSFFTYKLTNVNIENTQFIAKTNNTKNTKLSDVKKSLNNSNTEKSNTLITHYQSADKNKNVSHVINNQTIPSTAKVESKKQKVSQSSEKLNQKDEIRKVEHSEQKNNIKTTQNTPISNLTENNTKENDIINDDKTNTNNFNNINQIYLNHKDLTHVSYKNRQHETLNSSIDLTQKGGSTHSLGVELSKGVGNNFNSNNSMSFRNALYLSYQFKPLKTKFNSFSYGIDAGIYHQNLNDYVYETNYTVYRLDGNVDHYWYKMVYKDVLYFSVKPTIYFNLNSKHRIKLAPGIDKLTTLRLNMQYKVNEDIPTEENNKWGLNKGFNDLDFNVNLGYEFQVNSKIYFTINARYGIIDKTNDNYLKKSKNDIDKSLLLGLKYTLF